MYFKELIDTSDPSIVDFILVDDNYNEQRIARFNFKWNEGNFQNKECKKVSTLINKICKVYPNFSYNMKTISIAEANGKESLKQQKIIWEYETIARDLKSEYANSYTPEKLKQLFDRAGEIEKILIANNMQDKLILM